MIFKEGFFDTMGFVMLITNLENTFKFSTVDSDLLKENFESISAKNDFVILNLN